MEAAMKLMEVQELVSEVLNDLQSESEEHSLWLIKPSGEE
jgi:hypothetical protein